MKNFSNFLILTLVLVNLLFLPKIKAATSTLNYSNIHAENITNFSADIVWETDHFGSSFIAYGKWPFPPQDFGWGITLQECNMWTMNHVCHISFPGLAAGSTIYYHIQSVNSDNPNNAFSSEYTLITAPPFEITDLKVKDITDSTATVSWVSSEEGYSDVAYDTVAFAENGFNATTKEFITNHASTTPTLSHEVALADLSPNTVYYYRVRSVSELGANNTYGSIDSFQTFHTPVPLLQQIPVVADANDFAAEQGNADSVASPAEIKNNNTDLAKQEFINTERGLGKNPDAALSAKLSGRILLQVENKGEAWYIEPKTRQKYYLQDGESALQIMKFLGQGITNADLKKIPIGVLKQIGSTIDTDQDGLPDNLEQAIGTDPTKADADGDGYNDFLEIINGFNPLGAGKNIIDQSLAGSLRGRILLQVENKGEAWYINPVDSKRYYLGDKQMAYAILRNFGLGITNVNLRKIAVGFLSK